MKRSPMDLLEGALIDLESTVDLFETATDAMSPSGRDTGSMITVHRHVLRDTQELRKAYDAAWRCRNGKKTKGPAGGLSVVGGSGGDAA